MPNGGSDCCGTCWFNAKNKGQAGYAHSDDPEPAFCTIRGLALENPFYTYCANHPHRLPRRDRIPIGPVFTGDSNGTREFWRPSPDTEEIRQHLLGLLAKMGQPPASKEQFYPFGLSADEVVIRQLVAFRELRAIEGLRCLASSNPTESDLFGSIQRGLVDLASEALAKMAGAGRSGQRGPG